jgi:hypothetical protein
MYRPGSKPVSLQDIYESAGATQAPSPPKPSRHHDMYINDQPSSGRQGITGERLKNKLRPSNRPSARSGDQESDAAVSARGGYTGRSGFGGGDDYDPYNYQQGERDYNQSRDQRKPSRR